MDIYLQASTKQELGLNKHVHQDRHKQATPPMDQVLHPVYDDYDPIKFKKNINNYIKHS